MNENIGQPGEVYDLGVVLFWSDRPKLGQYGYLAPCEADAKRAKSVIYFDRDSLIAPNEPVTEGSLVHYDIKVDDLEGRFKAVNVEVERFTTHLPELDFKRSNLWDFPALKPSDFLGKRLLNGLSPELKGALKGYRNEDWREIPLELIDYLNAVIGGPLLCKKDVFAKLKPRRLTSLLYEKKPQGHELRWLNRLLLEDAYPKAFAVHRGD